jgi:hypothetical protein
MSCNEQVDDLRDPVKDPVYVDNQWSRSSISYCTLARLALRLILLMCLASGSQFSSIAMALSPLSIVFKFSASMSVSSSSACLLKGLLGRALV